MSNICSKSTIKTQGRHHWRRASVFIINFDLLTIMVINQLLTINHLWSFNTLVSVTFLIMDPQTINIWFLSLFCKCLLSFFSQCFLCLYDVFVITTFSFSLSVRFSYVFIYFSFVFFESISTFVLLHPIVITVMVDF